LSIKPKHCNEAGRIQDIVEQQGFVVVNLDWNNPNDYAYIAADVFK
jgi:hypothetical protein